MRDPCDHDRRRIATAFVPHASGWVESTLTERFLEQVVTHGERLAVTDRDEGVSYHDLACRAAGIAAAITDTRVERGGRVGLLAETGVPAVAAVLGVLQAGASFAPLDVLDPPPRARQLLDLAEAGTLLTSIAQRGRADEISAIGSTPLQVITLEEADRASTPGDSHAIEPGSPASAFFTSGSTGRPKAVLDLHRNTLHNVLRYTNLLEISCDDRLSLVQRMSFSGIASSLFSALLNGATLCTFPLSADSLPGLADWVESEEITIFHSVPAIFRALVRDGRTFPRVRVVRLEGDRATWADVERFRRSFAPTAFVANGLGTTETGLASQFRVGSLAPLESGVLPVGTSAPGMTLVLLDEHGTPSAEGSVGEIGVRSAFLAVGYLGEPELTAERFIADPEQGERLYRTGDLGRIDPSGRLEVLGRLDGTLKIGGARVEPAEIEAALLRIDGVDQAVVSIERGRSDEGRLVARVATSNLAVSEASLRRRLAERLPSFMVPGRIEVGPEISLDANWKLERAVALRSASGSALEHQLAAIWSEVLETEVGLEDTFVSLGGDSLAALEIGATIHDRLGIEVPLALLARAPTVAQLAASLGAEPEYESVSLVPLVEGDSGPSLLAIPDHRGQALMYATLATAVGQSTPMWGLQLEPHRDADLTVPAIARQIAAVLRDTRPAGPYVIAGYCYGAVLAIETTRLLRAEGEQVVPVLLGLIPTEFPSVVTPEALAGWRRRHGTRRLGLTRARSHVRQAHALGLRHGAAYLIDGTRSAVVRELRARRVKNVPSPLQRASRSFRLEPLPGSAILVLGEDAVTSYTCDPVAAWARLADQVEVRLVRGMAVGDVMLRAAGAPRLGEILSEILEETRTQTVPYRRRITLT